MATVTTVPLENLAQRIVQQQAQLERMRREHKARQNQLATLMRRKRTLQQQIQRVDGQIKAIAGAAGARPTLTSSTTSKPFKSSKRKPVKSARPMSVVLVDLIREAGGKPLTVGQMTQEVIRRRIPTSSSKPRKMIENRAYELVKKGVLRRAPNGSGFVLGKTAPRNGATSARRTSVKKTRTR
jgi:hypothetical protein